MRMILHGKAAGNAAVRAAVAELREEGVAVEVRVTWEDGDAVWMAREAVAQGVERVVAAGGDGTLSQVVAGVLEEAGDGDTAVAVGLLPLGTANDFAGAAQLSGGEPAAVLRLAARGKPVPVDVGEVDGHTFINVATGGFGSRVTSETPEELKRVLGGVAYLLTGLTRFSYLGAQAGRFEGPGFAWEGRFLALVVGNARLAGGGIPVCPRATIDDGLLEVAILPEPPEEERLPQLGALLRGGFAALEPQVISARVPELRATVPSGLHLNLDGEPMEGTRFHFRIRRRALHLVLPPDTPLLCRSGGG